LGGGEPGTDVADSRIREDGLGAGTRPARSPLRPPRLRAAAALIAAVAIVLATTPGWTAPFIPADDALVLESGLPTADPRVRQMRILASALQRRPDDLELAMRLASRQLAMGVAEADPRFVGYARGTLARWWRDGGAAPPLRVLRARILQAQHDFAPAAADLRAALRDAPDAAQALLVLEAVDEVTGDLAEAKETCAKLAALRPDLAASACAASIGSLTGESGKSYTALTDALAREPTAAAGVRRWALTILGEIAIRRGDPAAEQHLRLALALDARDIYALTVYADYLLDQRRPAEVLPLLRGFERVDALYLRLVLAAQATGDDQFPVYRDNIAARFAAARRQGDTLHLRDASRFALEVERDPVPALDYARRNWSVHETPYDARALLAAAIAAHDPAAARPVADWVARTRLEDRTIARLIREVAAGG
jgi:tetratricopeptide (TPR) repeat protein